MNKLISIFIPTYNRASVLDSILERVIKAVSKYSMDIYISDNNSTDDTEHIVLGWQEKYSRIFYNKNEQNLGPDRNMLNILDYNLSKYMLMLGDDDYVLDNFVESLAPFLKDDYDFIVLGVDTDHPTTVYDNVDEAFLFLHDKMTYGVLIMRTNSIQKQSMQKYIGTYHAYSAIAWEAAVSAESCGKSLYYNDTATVVLGSVEKTWKSNAADIYLYAIPMWYSLLPLNKITTNVVYKKYEHFAFSFRWLFSMKLNSNMTSLSSTRYFTFSDKLKFDCVSYIPVCMIAFAKKLMHYLKYNK